MVSMNKAILHKVDNGYVLLVDNVVYATDNDKLSKQNCDEIFGVIDVEKLADELKVGISYKEYDHLIKRGIIIGFNKAMELQKDKLFTVEDIKKAIEFDRYVWKHGEAVACKSPNKIDEFIQSLQKPTEIEVEIVMDDIWDGIDSARILPKEETSVPMLDKDDCLILKKK